MNPETHDDLARAAAWHVKLRSGTDLDWEDFTAWLEEDPAHAAAYDAVEQADADLDALPPQLSVVRAANDEAAVVGAPARRPSYWHYGMAMAASIVAAVLIVPHVGSSRYDVETRPGETRTIALDDATRVILNGGTRMTFDRRDARFAALRAGEALFRVSHDDERAFALEVGQDRVTDVGTVFDVVHDGGMTRVAVAEGEVRYEAHGGVVPLRPGQTLVRRADSGTVQVGATTPSAIGSWTRGRLTFSGAELQVVAADLARSLGTDVAVSPAIRRRAFTGTLLLDGEGPARLRRLAMALDVRLTTTARGLLMEPRVGEAP